MSAWTDLHIAHLTPGHTYWLGDGVSILGRSEGREGDEEYGVTHCECCGDRGLTIGSGGLVGRSEDGAGSEDGDNRNDRWGAEEQQNWRGSGLNKGWCSGQRGWDSEYGTIASQTALLACSGIESAGLSHFRWSRAPACSTVSG